MEYIHYGDCEFDIAKFQNITNVAEFTKPRGGLWGSRVNAEFGWKDWCLENDYQSDLENSFVFSLDNNAKLLVIERKEQLKELPRMESSIVSKLWVTLDFEKLSKDYDAIEVLISKDFKLYHELYGWDCDSILIMNPNIVK